MKEKKTKKKPKRPMPRTADDIIASSEPKVQIQPSAKEETKAPVKAPAKAEPVGYQYASQLATIREMGYDAEEFPDSDVKRALEMFTGDVEATIDEISALD